LLDTLARQWPDRLKYRANAALIRNNEASMMQDAGRFVEAEALYRQNLQLWEGFAAREPSVLDHRSKMALMLDNLADVSIERGQPDAAEPFRRRAIEIRAKIVSDFPNTPYWIGRLADGEASLAGLVAKRGDLVEARRLYANAVRHRRALIAILPDNPDESLALARTYSSLVETLLHLRAHADAAQAVNELVAVSGLPPEDLRRAGSFLARCASLVTADADLPAARRAELAGSYAGRAVTLLRDARAKGSWDRAALERDSSFDALRSRDDFRALLSARDDRPNDRRP
jgi:tetratricopeptide (TPR) repeat protein